MKKIKLYNRDGADLWLERIEIISNNISKWQLKVDEGHKYCLEHIRIIGNFPKEIDAIDPAGGPFISVADEFENKYKIVEILGPILFLISERNNNN